MPLLITLGTLADVLTILQRLARSFYEGEGFHLAGCFGEVLLLKRSCDVGINRPLVCFLDSR